MARARQGLLALVVSLLCFGMLWPADDSSPQPPPSSEALRAAIVERARASRPAAPGDERELSELERGWGIRIVGVRATAAGYLLDFRFRVLDPDRAAPLLDRRAQPRVVAEDGSVLAVPRAPKVGSLRQTSKTVRRDGIYFVLFANAGQRVRRGERVSITVDEFRADGLLVE